MTLEIRLTNTITHSKEIFEPINPDHVGMYLCGPTVYDRPHIGNARSAVAFDILHRFLKVCYPKVTYVRNVTDVDDKINARSKELGCSIKDLTTKTLAQYHADIGALAVLPPDIEPRATEHIPEMLSMITRLIEKGHAYEANGHVLFDVTSFKTYGALSRKRQEDLIAGARVEIAPYKRNAADFVLWKPSDPQTPGWHSPWGYGRPGWHIECSAMSARYLGPVFDIHGGGVDLVFPHHENEVAQSCCSHETEKMARYWLHNGHLTVGGAKMSKSDGNFITVHDLLKEQDGEVIRLALMLSHYRQPLDWTEDTLPQARRILDRYYGALALLNVPDDEAAVPDGVLSALADDLNVPGALAVLHELANTIYKNPAQSMAAACALKGGGLLLGLMQRTATAWFQGASLKAADDVDEAFLDEMIVQRNAAKAAKDFKLADQIRDDLLTKGYVLLDTPTGTTWRRK